MSDEASFPVFALGRGEVTEFPWLTTMQGYMEAVEIESDAYAAWDACGLCGSADDCDSEGGMVAR